MASDWVKDTSLKAKAKTKDFKIVLEDPRGRELVLEDSNTGYGSRTSADVACNLMKKTDVVSNKIASYTNNAYGWNSWRNYGDLCHTLLKYVNFWLADTRMLANGPVLATMQAYIWQ